MDSRGNQARPFSYLRAALLALGLLLLGSAAAYSQTRPSPTPPAPEPPSLNPTKPDPPDFGSPESEMRARQNLNAEKKQYDENVARARDAAQLATELVHHYEAQKALSSEDGKKLERLEKLTKRIRNEAGGSETDPDSKDIAVAMGAAVKQLAEWTDDLRKLVEKTPRHVISASVIDQANKLLGLIGHVRDAR
jgi:pyruvate/2-oxoacid:ferredoxin oxidoreductase alpha subunit